MLLGVAGRRGAENMAIDQALLEEADRSGRTVLRLYRWDPPCLSFGRNEPALVRYDRAAIARLGLDVVRRPTGGRAVWHEQEVTYAVAAPLALFGSLRKSYHWIHERLVTALRSLGVAAAIAPDHRPVRPADRSTACFAAAVGGEVLAASRKVIGSAQLRQGTAFLQHGSILLDGSQDLVRVVSRQPSAVNGETTLSAVLGRPVSFDEVAAAIVAAWGGRLTPSECPNVRPSDDAAWTWCR